MTPLDFVPPIPQTDIAILRDSSTSQANRDLVLTQIEARFAYVFETAMALTGRTWEWYDFANGNPHDADSAGFFDPEAYAEDIQIHGKIQIPDAKYVGELPDYFHFLIQGGVYSEFIPTRWLSEDFEDTLQQDWAPYLASIKAD